MTRDEFLDAVGNIAEENCFKCEYVIIVANEEGKATDYLHSWSNDIKRCKTLEVLSMLLGVGRKRFEKLNKK